MTLLDVETILLYPISMDVIADQCLDIFTKTVPTDGKRLKSRNICDE